MLSLLPLLGFWSLFIYHYLCFYGRVAKRKQALAARASADRGAELLFVLAASRHPFGRRP
jgi:hypothetical protein